MYDLHIANKNYSSWSLRPWILLRQLGLPFNEHIHTFGPGSNWQAFRPVSPTGKVPCLHADGEVVWDSLAIAEYLAERHSGVWPADAAARTWARCASAEMHSGFATLRVVCSMNCGLRIQLHEAESARIQADLHRLDELWCDGLSRFGGPFLAGAAFTAVDAFFAPVAFRIQTYGLILSSPAMAYADQLLALPAMKHWNEEALKEPWREQEHEAWSLKHGRLLADLR
ncbi:MAG: glutathione S-transferase family protein [Aquabacterium sp.]|uniref:glutathione S-transferase family protein n=1 Tax=Aquabacterium sp. TaxID=1872578 RepID=UPI0025C238D3|nr:glutathione S-transferase family protein [Aquabacterium sp.]MBI5927574.1 glutathione S-transferase family protein [Aquabacterium sp.]